jgi:hypothetical protein
MRSVCASFRFRQSTCVAVSKVNGVGCANAAVLNQRSSVCAVVASFGSPTRFAYALSPVETLWRGEG